MEEICCNIRTTGINVIVFVPNVIKGLAVLYPTGTDTMALYITKFIG